MNQTTNYQLNQWDPDDRVLRTDFNADNAKLDAALHALAAKDTALESALLSAVAGAGNCQMELVTYTGNGNYGAGNPTKIQFSRLPEVFFIGGGETLMAGRGGSDQITLIARNLFSETFISEMTHSWSGNQLSMVSEDNARYQMNVKGTAYWALGLYRKGD